ncbi:MAG: long-chain fatty acid--CoA ligase [Candidatus Aminicenantes bacterium]|nr:long-chain fatty acid--CoA ligase [Candidatus Aminicenantes bacterium]
MIETISQLFLNTVKSFPKDDFMLYKQDGKYIPISTNEYYEWVKHFSLALLELGIKRGDKLIILAENGPKWVMADLANICLGGISVPVYTSLIPEQIKYIIDNSDAKVVVVSDLELWKKVESIRGQLNKVEHYISFMDEAPAEDVFTFKEIIEKGRKVDEENPGLFEKKSEEIKPDDIASIIYTSGTTGVPKGVQLTHGNFLSNVKTCSSILDFDYKDTVLSFLPLSHVLERMVTFTYIYRGCTVAYAESVETVAENLLEIRPNIMVSVPRVFEKIYSRVMDNVLASPSLKRKIFFWAANVGRQYSQFKLNNRSIPGSLQFKRNLAHKLVFSKIIEKTGGRVKFFVSGGAALSKDIAEFFYAMGLVVLEGYGLTETSPVIAVNTFDNLRFGSVGKPIPGVEVKIAEDGEILTRGPHVMKGYYKMPAETMEAMEGDWFHTGDIGHLDEDGFLVITDRKKDLIVTSGGKNVAPQMIENILKIQPFITSAVVIGDGRKFVSALIVPDFDKLEAFAKEKDLIYSNRKELIENEVIVKKIEEEVEKCSRNLAPYEQIKKIILLERDFELEEGEVTPSLKVRRNIVQKKYAAQIDALYAGQTDFPAQ